MKMIYQPVLINTADEGWPLLLMILTTPKQWKVHLVHVLQHEKFKFMHHVTIISYILYYNILL